LQEITVFDSDGNTMRNLVQWDSDVYVYITEEKINKATAVHFFNDTMDSAYVVSSTYSDSTLKAKIPNTLLTMSYPIIGYVQISEQSETKSIYRFRLNVIKRPKPDNYVLIDSKDYVTFDEIVTECKQYASAASGSASDASNSATQAKSYADQISEQQKEIDETIKNSLLSSSEDILASIEDYFKKAEELYRSCTIVCDGEVPCRRARTIVEIDCHTPQRRATGYAGIEFDGGTPSIRLLGE